MTTDVISPEFDRDAVVANRLHVRLRRDLAKALVTSWQLGRILWNVKTCLPHGHWLPWVRDRLEFGERMAQKYIKYYESVCLKYEPDSHLESPGQEFVAQVPVEDLEQCWRETSGRDPLRISYTHIRNSAAEETPPPQSRVIRVTVNRNEATPSERVITVQTNVAARSEVATDPRGAAVVKLMYLRLSPQERQEVADWFAAGCPAE
jgi:hypothetical protein